MDDVVVYADPDRLAAGMADLVVALADAAVAARGRFTVALAGGNTPRRAYAQLAAPDRARRVPWDRVRVFFGDERCVPPDDVRSNFRMARESLLDRVPLPAAHVHRIAGEDDPAAAARAYEAELRRCGGDGEPPALDLVCLGLGDNGHTASLFPGAVVLHERRRWVAAVQVDAPVAWRVTMTPVLLAAARDVVFLVSGADKAAMLRRVLDGPCEPDLLPAQLLRGARGRVRWLVDAAAAAERTGP